MSTPVGSLKVCLCTNNGRSLGPQTDGCRHSFGSVIVKGFRFLRRVVPSQQHSREEGRPLVITHDQQAFSEQKIRGNKRRAKQRRARDKTRMDSFNAIFLLRRPAKGGGGDGYAILKTISSSLTCIALLPCRLVLL